jgi:hypothetical protein
VDLTDTKSTTVGTLEIRASGNFIDFAGAYSCGGLAKELGVGPGD